MSGIYIPGMEMPKSCFECRFSIDGFCYASGHVNIRANDERQITSYCPLIPVPDHGDLIDRDKLEKDIDRYIGGEESRSRFHHWVQVQDAVIPMDKGEEK